MMRATPRSALPRSAARQLTGFGNPAPISYGGSVTAVTIRGGKAAERYDIVSTSGDAVTTVQGGAASDTFNVGGTGPTGSLDNIQGPLSIVGGGGTNALNADDQGSAVGHMYVLSAGTLSRDGNMPISFNGIQKLALLGNADGNALIVSALPTASTLADLVPASIR